MIRISTSELRETLSEVVNRVIYSDKRYVLHRHQKDVAVIVSLSEWERLKKLSHDARESNELTYSLS